MYMSVNGELIDVQKAALSPFDHGFLYGVGLFETMRVYNGHPFLFRDHAARMTKGLGLLNIRVNQGENDWLSTLKALLKVNKLTDAYVRLNISAGRSALGLQTEVYTDPTVIVFVKPFSLSRGGEKKGVLLKTRRNRPETSIRLKSHQFLNNVLAKREIGHVSNAEGIFLTEEGYVAEGIVSNLFWVKNGVVYTPALETGILNGVTRRFVIELLKTNGIPYFTGLYEFDDLMKADEVFMTNSMQEIVPFFDIEGQKFPGIKGEMVQTLLQDYAKYREMLWSYKQLSERA